MCALTRRAVSIARRGSRLFATQNLQPGTEVFNRTTKRLQRNVAGLRLDSADFDFLRDEIADRLTQRLEDTHRKFNVALDWGCHSGHIFRSLVNNPNRCKSLTTLYQCDGAENLLLRDPLPADNPDGLRTHRIVADEEFIPFKPGSMDLVTSSLSLHWVNDLQGTLQQIRQVLKPDACFLGAMFGGDTLKELRQAFALAEQERDGGVSPHVSPFVSGNDLGWLLTNAGFTLTTVDVDTMVIHFPDAFSLMHHLQGMGEGNCLVGRRAGLPRSTLVAAAAAYEALHMSAEGLPATFQVFFVIGWTPDPSQQKSAKRGSATASLRDLGTTHVLTD